MSASTVELMNRGMNCLIEQLGNVEAERFVAAIMREKFDYTKWRQEHWPEMTSEEFNAAAVAYAKTIERKE